MTSEHEREYLKVKIEDAGIECSTHKDVVEHTARHAMGFAEENGEKVRGDGHHESGDDCH